MSKYSAETKAAVMASLLQGQSISAVAREYKIPKGTVSGWKNRGVAKKATQKRANQIGDLLLEYLNENLVTLREQSKFARDTQWLKRQDAADFAVLHGVLTDKAIRLLEAMDKSGNGNS